MTRLRAAVVILVALAGAGLSWALLRAHHGEGTAVDALCGETTSGPSGCDVVNRSAYASVLGIPLAAVGLAFYLSLALLMLLGVLAGGESFEGAAFVGFALLVLALAVDAALLGVQAVALKAFCRLCLITYGLSAAGLAALLPARRASLSASGLSRSPAGRMLLAAWLAGSGAFVVTATALHAALAAREGQRQATLLGSPSPAPAPAATTTTAPATTTAAPPATEAERYKQEAARLQGILDDPQKLDQYFADKAARDFAAAKVQTIDLSDVPMKGPVAAPVTAVEYSDFLCPFCRNLAVALAGYIPQAGNRLTLYFKNFPLEQECNSTLKRTIHPGACALALGGICATEQGKFWAYHDRVFQAPPPNPGLPDVERLGQQAGLDAAALKACLSSPKAKQRLAREIAEAAAIGVDSTPTLFVNGKKLPRINDFGHVVDQEAAKQGVPPLAPPGK